MASWISVNKDSWLDKAIQNFPSAKDAFQNNIVEPLKGDIQRMKDGTWMTTAKDNIPVAQILNGDNSTYGMVDEEYYPVSQGEEAENPYEALQKLILDTTKANNDWSAAQAQKQMDFQREMSSTAHQREVEDLQKAGLNPVLSAGGSGSSTPTGAMGDTDTSGTRVIADVALEAINAMANTAIGVAGGAGGAGSSGSGKNASFWSKLSNWYAHDKLGKKMVDSTVALGSAAMKYKMLGKLVPFL